MFRFVKNTIIMSMLTYHYCFASVETSLIINEHFRYIDSTISMLVLEIESAGNDTRRVDSSCNEILKMDSSFHSFLVVDAKGCVVVEASRDGSRRMLFEDVSERKWFYEPQKKNVSTYLEVIRIGMKKCLLKGRLLFNSPGTDTDSTFIFAAIIDLEFVFTKMQGYFKNPAALIFNSSPIYESNWIEDASTVFPIPGYNGVKFVIAQNPEIDSTISNAKNEVFFGMEKYSFLIFGFSIFFAVFGLSTFGISRVSLKKVKNAAFIEIAHKKLSSEEKERIHKMAVSHVYCEVKRRIETHEAQEIENRIRSEVENEIKKKITQNLVTAQVSGIQNN